MLTPTRSKRLMRSIQRFIGMTLSERLIELSHIQTRLLLVRRIILSCFTHNNILTAHVSSCGKYLTILFETSRILIIRDLERLFKGEVPLFDCTIEVQLGKASRFSTYHSFENGRVGVATVSCSPLSPSLLTYCYISETGSSLSCPIPLSFLPSLSRPLHHLLFYVYTPSTTPSRFKTSVAYK